MTLDTENVKGKRYRPNYLYLGARQEPRAWSQENVVAGYSRFLEISKFTFK